MNHTGLLEDLTEGQGLVWCTAWDDVVDWDEDCPAREGFNHQHHRVHVEHEPLAQTAGPMPASTANQPPPGGLGSEKVGNPVAEFLTSAPEQPTGDGDE